MDNARGLKYSSFRFIWSSTSLMRVSYCLYASVVVFFCTSAASSTPSAPSGFLDRARALSASMMSSSMSSISTAAAAAPSPSPTIFPNGFGRPISLGNTKLHAAREKMRYELDGPAYKSFSVSGFFAPVAPSALGLRAGASVFRFFASRSLFISDNRSC